ncbi:MAG: hypothetical protein M3360_02085 [Actinomycetota bacterium]|nr:hypothetical protein [Actinomycetota bacterium]
MGLADKIAEQREQQIVERARPHLAPGEEVVHWVRACNPRSGKRGFAFLTPHRLLLLWGGKTDRHGEYSWSAIDSWGVNRETSGGPILAVEQEGSSALIQMPVESVGMAERVTHFLYRLASLAPKPRHAPAPADFPGVYDSRIATPMEREKRSVVRQTRRIIVTVVGVVLVVLGLLLLVLPGPGILVTLLGLAVLGSEFDWAQDLLGWVRSRWEKRGARAKSRRSSS